MQIQPTTCRVLTISVLAIWTSATFAQSSSRALPMTNPAFATESQISMPQDVGLPIEVPASATSQRIPSGQVLPVQSMPANGSTSPSQPVTQPFKQSVAQPVEKAANESTGGRNISAPTFEMKLWNYINKAKYRYWAPVPGESEEAYRGEGPHGEYLKMYLNRRAAGNPDQLPYGSMIIKENYAFDGISLEAITLMYRVEGYNPKAADWYWVKFNSNGSVSQKSTPNGSIPVAGKVSACIDCHDRAEDEDFVFFNDADSDDEE